MRNLREFLWLLIAAIGVGLFMTAIVRIVLN